MALRELVALLGYGVDDAGAKRAHAQVEGLKKAALGLSATFGLALAGTEIVKGFGRMIGLASDAEQQTQRLSATFGEAAPGITSALSSLGSEAGKSQLDLMKTVNTLGAFLTGATGSKKAAADMAVGLAGAAADMEAFFDIPAEEATSALRAGLAGATRGLLAFGVDVRDAAIEQYALSKGIKTATKDMSKATITALRYELILKELGRTGATGDAAGGSREFEGATRGLKAALEDLAVSGGQRFLGIATRVVMALRDLALGAKDAMRPGENLARAFDALGQVFQVVVDNGRVAFGAIAAILALLFPGAVIVGLLAGAVLLLIDDLTTLGAGGESVIGTLVDGFTSLWDEVGLGEAIFETLRTAVKFWADFFGVNLNRVSELWDQFLSGLTTAWDETTKGAGAVFEMATRTAVLASPVGLTAGAAALGQSIGNSLTSSNEINITMQGVGGDPDAIASKTGEVVRERMDESLRQAHAALVEGGE